MSRSPRSASVPPRQGVSPSCVSLPPLKSSPWATVLDFLHHSMPTVARAGWALRLVTGPASNPTPLRSVLARVGGRVVVIYAAQILIISIAIGILAASNIQTEPDCVLKTGAMGILLRRAPRFGRVGNQLFGFGHFCPMRLHQHGRDFLRAPLRKQKVGQFAIAIFHFDRLEQHFE